MKRKEKENKKEKHTTNTENQHSKTIGIASQVA
jgi:hypothetical protein